MSRELPSQKGSTAGNLKLAKTAFRAPLVVVSQSRCDMSCTAIPQRAAGQRPISDCRRAERAQRRCRPPPRAASFLSLPMLHLSRQRIVCSFLFLPCAVLQPQRRAGSLSAICLFLPRGAFIFFLRRPQGTPSGGVFSAQAPPKNCAPQVLFRPTRRIETR